MRSKIGHDKLTWRPPCLYAASRSCNAAWEAALPLMGTSRSMKDTQSLENCNNRDVQILQQWLFRCSRWSCESDHECDMSHAGSMNDDEVFA